MEPTDSTSNYINAGNKSSHTNSNSSSDRNKNQDNRINSTMHPDIQAHDGLCNRVEHRSGLRHLSG